jgi:hypothetical protein
MQKLLIIYIVCDITFWTVVHDMGITSAFSVVGHGS